MMMMWMIQQAPNERVSDVPKISELVLRDLRGPRRGLRTIILIVSSSVITQPILGAAASLTSRLLRLLIGKCRVEIQRRSLARPCDIRISCELLDDEPISQPQLADGFLLEQHTARVGVEVSRESKSGAERVPQSRLISGHSLDLRQTYLFSFTLELPMQHLCGVRERVRGKMRVHSNRQAREGAGP